MDDNLTLEPQQADENINGNPDAPVSGPAADAASDTATAPQTADRIFDITSDLDIAPSTGEADVVDGPKPTSASITAEVEAALRQFSAGQSQESAKSAPASMPPGSIPPASVTSAPIASTADASTSPAAASVTPTPIAPAAPRVSPANPPVKTVAAPSFIQPQAQEPTLASLSATLNPNAAEVEKNLGLKRLRTYEGDVAELMSRRHTSTAQIAIAEQKRETGSEAIASQPAAEESGEPTHAFRNILITIVSLVLIAGGVVAGYYLYTQSLIYISAPSGKTVPAPASISSIVPADSHVTVQIDSSSKTRILSQIQSAISKDEHPGTITDIVPIQTVNGTTVRLSAPDMLNLMKIPAPDILSRSLTDEWMLGMYTDMNGGKNAFVVVTNDFFQNAFAGMLQWEPVMPDDLRQYLFTPGAVPSGIASGDNSAQPAIVGSTTQTAAPLTQNFGAIRGGFRDRIIHNKDVREFVTSDGQVLFLYSFIDSSRLVVTGSEQALTEILSRLDKQTYVR